MCLIIAGRISFPCFLTVFDFLGLQGGWLAGWLALWLLVHVLPRWVRQNMCSVKE